MSLIITVLLVLVAAVCGALGFYLGGENRKRTAEAKIGSAEDEAKRIVNDAIKTAEAKRKETIVEAKDEAFKLKSEADKEIKDRRAEITRQERRMDQKEEALDKRSAAMERKEEDLKRRTETVEARLDELEQLKMRQTEKLETIAAMSQEDARAVLLKQVDDELTHEKAMKISAYQANMKDECDNIARELVGQAIARCAADATSEATVSVVPLPSDEMKGRIIGREGRTTEKILYIDYQNRMTRIHTAERVIPVSGGFQEVTAALQKDKRFLPCYRGVLINMDYISQVDSQTFRLINGEALPIALRNGKQLRETYRQYVFSGMGRIV